MMRPPLGTCTGLLFALGLTAAAAPPPDFDRDVKPILEHHCFKCHGPEKQKAGLRLDQKPSALKGGESGEPAIVPGNALKSHLLQLVTSNDPDVAMPPKGDRLKPEQIALLQRWVETGAHWIDQSQPQAVEVVAVNADPPINDKDRQFWSFVPPRRVAPPATRNNKWSRT